MDPLPSLLLQATPPPAAPEGTAATGPIAILVRAAGTFLGTAVVGALLFTLAPAYTERVVDTVGRSPAACFLWGIAILIGLVVATVGLVVLAGALALLPFLLVMLVLYMVGSALVFVAVGERLLEAADVETSRWGTLAAGAALAALLAALPLVGGLANFVVNSVGVGAIAYRWLGGGGVADE